MFDRDWTELLFVNPAYEEVYGRSRAELEGDPRSFLETVHPDDLPAVRKAMEALTAGEAVDIEYRINPDRDHDRWVWVQAEPITENGEVTRIAGFTRDVTDRHRRVRQLFVMDNLLRHNLRNDLNVILGVAEEIEEEAPEVAERTAVIRRTGEALLETARKERDVIDMLTDDCGAEYVDLRAAVADAVERLHTAYPDATFDASTTETAPVTGRPELRQAVVELLENAIRHSETDAPHVAVDVRRVDDRIELTVTDDAAPIPPYDAEVLLGDHRMNDVYHSSGLGLWVVYWSVELSDGTISVDATEDRGNRIVVTLPAASE
ncbi:PAS domain-containing protein [Halobaculum litoreum]|uniref:histidine kinase n=1 Tax=Halobaculum litoreum TaxID=3031998 RepID=A0ABD5XSP4_9EURY